MISRTSTPASAGRSSRPMARSRGGGRGAHATSSPVSSTNRSSRFAGRRSPSGTSPFARSTPSTRHRRAGAARVEARGARLGLGLGQPRGRAVDLDRLAARRARPRARTGGPVGDRLAVGHDRHGVGEALGLLDVVRRHQDRDALGAQRVDQRPQLLADLRVEADGRLVEQHEPRPVHERARDQQPPAHAARELVRARVAAVGELRDLERALDRRLALAARDPVEVREHAQVLLDGQRRVEVVELRHDAHLGARRLRVARQRVAEHLDLALVGDRLRGQQPHRGRLARAVGPEQPDAGALRHLEVEVVDGGDRAVALDTPRSGWRVPLTQPAYRAPRGALAASTSARNSASWDGASTSVSACHCTASRNGWRRSSIASIVPSGAHAVATQVRRRARRPPGGGRS